MYGNPNLVHSQCLRLRDRVIVDIIESDCGKFSWRATKGKLDPLLHVTQPCIVNLSTLLEDDNDNSNNGSKQSISVKEDYEDNDLMIQQNISVSKNLKIVINGIGMTEFVIIDISNDSEDANLLENIMIYSEKKTQLYVDKHFLKKLPIKIEPKQKLKVVLPCIGHHLDNSVELCLLCFKDFSIERKINIIVNQRKTSTCMGQRAKAIDSVISGRIIKGEKPCYASPFIPVKLPYADVPDKLWDLILNKIDPTGEFPVLAQPLNYDNYIEKFSTLLFLEEIEQDMQIRKYDIPCAAFDHHGDYLALTVNGLAEKRPSLLVGDTVIASNIVQGDSEDIRYEGCIHEVLHNKVLLKFHPEFQSQYNDEDYSIQLCCNRTPLRRCHLGISLVTQQLGTRIMFPTKLNFQLPQVCYIDDSFLTNPITAAYSQTSSFDRGKKKIASNVNCYSKQRGRQMIKIRNTSGFKSDKNGYCIPIASVTCKKVFELPHLKWFNSELNFEQRLAVKRILEGSTRPLPYIIYGPPGTGKTVTIVEAILQIFTMVPHSRILVVTPSNSASDLVAERAIQNGCLKKGDLIRIYSFNKSGCAISEKLSEFVDKENSIEVAVRHRIIVSTVTNSGILYTAKLKNGHFTHVFIDEAGQLTEPETCISLGLVNSSSGQVVLAGDPKQLGPVVMSSLAKRFGLGKSLLHRLCSSVLYQPQNLKLQEIYSPEKLDGTKTVHEFDKELSNDTITFEPRLVTLLVRNYRSHADLISVSSRLFYHDNLISCASLEVQNRLLSWPELPSPSVPLVFHSVRGENQQEGDSPSWFNPAEAFQVCRYANSLVKFGLDPLDIGIITPYKKQVEKIRKLLSAFEVEDIKVGPVEEFQGQERVAIILSTVRSTENLIEADVQHSLGFLQCAERFNVAITRAMSLLVVVGNPFLLKEDPHWSIFLSFCVEKGVIKQ